MILDQCDECLAKLIDTYVALLDLPTDDLKVTTSRSTYRTWLGRLVPASYGGAYCYLTSRNTHAILINLERIDTTQPRAVELVVAEELVHMRDRLDGDLRRHSHHGHDRIAMRVAEITGASLEEIRSTLLPANRRPVKYIYQCPGCGMTVQRRRRGTWSCRRCSPVFSRKFQMRIIQYVTVSGDGMD